MWIVFFVFIGLCLYFAGYPVWWVLSIPAAAAAMFALYALYALYETSTLAFVFLLLIFDISAYVAGVSLWWVLGVPAGFVLLWVLYHHRDIERRYRESGYAYSVPRHNVRTINERTHLLPSHTSRPHAETPKRIVPSQSSYISQSPIVTAPRVLPTLPSNAILVIVELRLPQYTTPTYPSPAVVDTRRSLYANPTSGALTIAAGRQLVRVAQPARKIPRPEVDGIDLHASVTAEVNDRYLYDQQIKTDSAPHSTTRSVTGVFKCYSCERKKGRPEEPRIWTSNGICVEIWMSSTGHQYRTRLHSQMCNRCNTIVEPDVMIDDYVTKVVKVLDRWTRQHSVVKPLQRYAPTGPHQTDKCNACLKGICHQKPTK